MDEKQWKDRELSELLLSLNNTNIIGLEQQLMYREFG